ncbi:MAG: sporulation protein YunB [Bacillota bacterium]
MNPKKHFSRRRALLAAGAIALCLLVAFVALSIQMHPALVTLATTRVEALASEALQSAIYACAQDEANYSDLIMVSQSENRVYLLQANTRKMNLLAAQTTRAALESIRELGTVGLSIPVGTLSGISMLSGIGPPIHVTFAPAGSVKSDFHSEFSSAGVNQTLHRIYLQLSVDINIVLPGADCSVTLETKMPVAENVIMGDVPQTYTDVANEEDMLNLLPNGPD